MEIIELEVMPDHVHMLIEVDPQFGAHRAVKRFKGATSRYLRMEFPELKKRLPSLWTNSYFVSTVGGAPMDVAINEHNLEVVKLICMRAIIANIRIVDTEGFMAIHSTRTVSYNP